jgi:hypothetical protein
MERLIALGAQLHDDVAADIGRPEAAVGVNAKAVRASEELVAERPDERAVLVELTGCARSTGAATRFGDAARKRTRKPV